MSNEELVEIQNATPEQQESDELLAAIPDDKPAEEDFLAAFIEREIASVRSCLEVLGKNALKRVVLNVMSGPEFSKREYKPVTIEEKKVAYHFDQCIQKRAMLWMNEEWKRLEASFAKEQEDLKKIDQITQDALTPEAKQMLAESGDKVEIRE